MMRKNMMVILVFGLIALASCDKSDTDTTCDYNLEISEEKFSAGPYDPTTTIQQVDWDDSCLVITFGYSGGCQDHSFNLVSDGAVLYTQPPSLTLGLVHDNQDDCEAYITEKISVDILDFPNITELDSVYIKFKEIDDFSYLLKL